jgi:hypothetical protein
VWLAHPEDLNRTELLVPAMAQASSQQDEDLSAWGITDDETTGTPEQEPPVVESPSIAAGWPADNAAEDADWTMQARNAQEGAESAPAPRFGSGYAARFAWLSRLRPRLRTLPFHLHVSAATACAGMAALVLALMIWRTDVVRLMPQTAAFYKLAGLEVNLRGLSFKDVKVATETVDGKTVLVIEGTIVSETRKPVPMPRLRFIVRDAHGTEIYAWSAVLEQQGLNPGDKAWFRSRLASPPADGRNLDIRFFTKNDIGA